MSHILLHCLIQISIVRLSYKHRYFSINPLHY